MKTALQQAIWACAAGRNDGLSWFGLAIERASDFAQFVTRELRQQALMSSRTDKSVISSPLEGLAFDVGANNGDDTFYYLQRGMRVVAIEANPSLVQRMNERFPEEIKSGRLTVLNFAIVRDVRSWTDFFINDENDTVSTVVPGVDTTVFRPIRVASRRLPGLIQEYGVPLYIKLDVEGIDDAVLEDIFEADHKPQFISAEAHSVRTFIQLVKAGYRKFKIVEGRFVHRPYYALKWRNEAGNITSYEFPKGSSGPFGNDIPGPWLSADDVFQYLACHGVGWKDIHASL